MAWPKEVPVLTAKDMLIGPFCNVPMDDCLDTQQRVKKGTCGCMQFWRAKLFGVHEPDIGPYVHRASMESARELRIPYVTNFHNETGEYFETKVTKGQAARCMNRTTARLGYVVNNPECRKDGTLKPV